MQTFAKKKSADSFEYVTNGVRSTIREIQYLPIAIGFADVLVNYRPSDTARPNDIIKKLPTHGRVLNYIIRKYGRVVDTIKEPRSRCRRGLFRRDSLSSLTKMPASFRTL